MRYQTIDRCTDPCCRCLDSAGVILYDGEDSSAAEAAKSLAAYPSPQIVPIGLTCIHSLHGLCPDCQAAFDYDPQSWLEAGDHPAGIAARAETMREIEAAGPAPPAGPDLPY